MPFKYRASGNTLWGAGGGRRGGQGLQREEEELEETAGFPAPARPGAPEWSAKANGEAPAKQRREEYDMSAGMSLRELCERGRAPSRWSAVASSQNFILSFILRPKCRNLT